MRGINMKVKLLFILIIVGVVGAIPLSVNAYEFDLEHGALRINTSAVYQNQHVQTNVAQVVLHSIAPQLFLERSNNQLVNIQQYTRNFRSNIQELLFKGKSPPETSRASIVKEQLFTYELPTTTRIATSVPTFQSEFVIHITRYIIVAVFIMLLICTTFYLGRKMSSVIYQRENKKLRGDIVGN